GSILEIPSLVSFGAVCNSQHTHSRPHAHTQPHGCTHSRVHAHTRAHVHTRAHTLPHSYTHRICTPKVDTDYSFQ
uniref:Uncharacterized protein n=1 Tax=Ursus maritimus TaxID=29073 RepID=A0A452TA47_URSMA